jgi:hypothetical protein
MQQNEKASIDQGIFKVIADDYYNDFTEIFSLVASLTDAIPAQANNEIRNALNHLGRASATEDITDAESNIDLARWHIALAKSDCLKIGIIHQSEVISDLITNIENASGRILSDLRLRSAELTARRRDVLRDEQRNPAGSYNEKINDFLEELLTSYNNLLADIIRDYPESQKLAKGTGISAARRFIVNHIGTAFITGMLSSIILGVLGSSFATVLFRYVMLLFQR